MKKKREARAAYYQGLKVAMSEHIEATEEGIRALVGVSKEKKAKLLASIRKQHEKLLKRIDDQFSYEIAADKIDVNS